jgi:predicted nucleic acid-binding protein
VIILDTNVVSEMMKASPTARVTKWLASHAHSRIFTTSITQAEIFFGLEIMPHGRKREALHKAASAMFKEKFVNHVLAFDGDASHTFAVIAAARRRTGQPIGLFDCQIAAIARLHGAAIATRDLRDFAHCGVELIDPWSDKTRSDQTKS